MPCVTLLVICTLHFHVERDFVELRGACLATASTKNRPRGRNLTTNTTDAHFTPPTSVYESRSTGTKNHPTELNPPRTRTANKSDEADRATFTRGM